MYRLSLLWNPTKWDKTARRGSTSHSRRQAQRIDANARNMQQGGAVRLPHFVKQHRQCGEECLSRAVGSADVAGERLDELRQIAVGQPFKFSVDRFHDRFSLIDDWFLKLVERGEAKSTSP